MASRSGGWEAGRRELLDHVVALNERHLKRLLSEYVRYHHEDRTHLGLGHLRAEFVPKLRVESFHRSDSEGCTIVTIERHSPDRFSTGPYIMCAPRARGLAPSTPSRAFLLYRTDLPTL